MLENTDILLIGKISRKRLDLLTMLDKVAESIIISLDVNVCAILMLDELGQVLSLKSARGLSAAAVNAVRLPKGRGVTWKAVRERRSIALRVARDDPDFYYVPEAEEKQDASMVATPIIDEEGVALGVVYIQRYDVEHDPEEDARDLEKITTSVAGAIRAARDFQRQVEMSRVLSELNNTARLINATNNSELILSHTGDCVRNTIGARLCAIWLLEGERPILKSLSGGSLERPELMLIAVERALMTKEVMDFPDVRGNEEFPGLAQVAGVSMTFAPMVFENKSIGVLVMMDRKTALHQYFTPFTSGEIKSFKDLTQTTTQALVRAQTHRRLEMALEENRQNMKELSILFQLSMALQRTISLDDLLRVILSCVTVGTGLGFNRAILFLINESTGLLQGMIGLGPDSPEDAGRIWSQPDSKPDEELVNWLLSRGSDNESISAFDKAARSLRMVVAGEGASSVAHSVVVEKKAVLVNGSYDLDNSDRELSRILGYDRFAMVPLVAKDNVLGAILVDNRFDAKPITSRDMRLLVRFAAPAAWAIENIRLMERLSTVSKELIRLENQMARVERMSTLGEVAAEMAHEIKNPLVSIGGFARRLKKESIPREESSKYLDIILEEVERLEKMLRNALDVSKGVSMKIEKADLNGIVEEAISFYWRLINENRIETVMSLSRDIVNVTIDPVWIRQVVINIILNSIEALSSREGERKLTLATSQAPGHAGWIRLSISDTGGGIKDMNLDEVFEPFFTTKEHGTGIGLTLAKKIIRMHHGDLEIDNRPGVGVTFNIDLPCQIIPGSPG